MTGYLNLPPYSFRDGKDFLPASLLFALHATLSLFALHGMNIPMYGAIKRCTPLVSLILSVIVLRKAVPSKPIVLSILLITLGCLIASIGDLEFDGHAYFMGLLSVFAQGGYLTLVQRSSSEMKKSTLEMIHINGFNTLPFFAITSIAILEPVNIAESNSFFGKIFGKSFHEKKKIGISKISCSIAELKFSRKKNLGEIKAFSKIKFRKIKVFTKK